jgi:hypothetical protein
MFSLSKAPLVSLLYLGGWPSHFLCFTVLNIILCYTREERERNFTTVIDNVVSRGGACLIPVFALGRAQELLLILDEYWQAHPELQNIPIYYASKLASKALRVYQTFINTMSDHIRTLMDISNPFKLRCIQNMVNTDEVVIQGPCVVMAAPGFLQSGVSRQLFDRWCEDEKNCVLIAGYTVEGTLAHDLLSAPKEVTGLDNRIRSRNCDIEHITFSAHVDYTQNSAFIRSVKPDNIILVHGEKTGMKRLKDELDREIRKNWPGTHKPPVVMPENGIKVRLRFNKPIEADVVGRAAAVLQEQLQYNNHQGQLPESALLVTESFQSRVVCRDELPIYTSCRPGSIRQRILLPLPATVSELFLATKVNNEKTTERALLVLLGESLEEIFDVVATYEKEIIIQNDVSVSLLSSPPSSGTQNAPVGSAGVNGVLVEWLANPINDMIADSAISVVTQTLSVPNLLQLNLRSYESNKSFGKHDNATSASRGRELGTVDSSSASTATVGGRRRKASSRSPEKNTAIKAEMQDNGSGRQRQDLIKKMKSSELDPRVALSPEVVELLKNQSSTTTATNIVGAGPLEEPSHRLKLERLRNLILAADKYADVFESIKLNGDHTKLIFRSKTQPAVEAFVFILFSGEEDDVGSSDVTMRGADNGADGTLHNAVINCSNPEFRQVVSHMLQSL